MAETVRIAQEIDFSQNAQVSQELKTSPLGPIFSEILLEGCGTAHAPGLGAAEPAGKAVQCTQSSIHTPVYSKTKQVIDCTADLRKVSRKSVIPKVELSPSLVSGRWEDFQSVGALIKEWEHLEGNESEWEVVGGVRRGGKRVSRRVTELMGKFEKGGGPVYEVGTVESDDCVKKGSILKSTSIICQNQDDKKLQVQVQVGRVTFSSSCKGISSSSPSVKHNLNINNDVGAGLVRVVDRIEMEHCDWPTDSVTPEFAANRKPACRKRIREYEDMIIGSRQTKKLRP